MSSIEARVKSSGVGIAYPPTASSGAAVGYPRAGEVVVSDVRVRLGQRLRELREDAGLSQQSLAQAAGDMSRAYVASLELGEKAASIQTIERLAKALKVPLTALVDFRGPKPKALTPEERLAALVVSLARGASEEELEKFEKLARVYFADLGG